METREKNYWMYCFFKGLHFQKCILWALSKMDLAIRNNESLCVCVCVCVPYAEWRLLPAVTSHHLVSTATPRLTPSVSKATANSVSRPNLSQGLTSSCRETMSSPPLIGRRPRRASESLVFWRSLCVVDNVNGGSRERIKRFRALGMRRERTREERKRKSVNEGLVSHRKQEGLFPSNEALSEGADLAPSSIPSQGHSEDRVPWLGTF